MFSSFLFLKIFSLLFSFKIPYYSPITPQLSFSYFFFQLGKIFFYFSFFLFLLSFLFFFLFFSPISF